MAYQVNKTDGTIVATVADGQVDQLSTDLTLIGKNYSGFGEYLNENFIKILENFASTSRPTQPIRGQIWFDVSELKLKVYNGSDFLPVSSATISSTQPTTLAAGDLWFDDVGSQLYFFDGSNPILLGPSYSATQGISGLKVDSVLDTLNQTRVITSLYNNGILLGIFAKDSFTPKTAIIGYSGSIQPGFNAGTLSGIKFNVTCTNAEQLGGAAATTYVRKDTSNAVEGQLRVTTDLGVVIGSAGQANIYVTSGDIFFTNSSTDKNLYLNVRKGITQEDAVVINSSNRTIDLYLAYADSNVRTGGNLIVGGDLTVEGTTTTINTTNVTVEDKNIVIANVGSPTDVTADGAGITIKGDTDKTIAYSQSYNWLDVSEDINLASEKSYLIGGTPVIQPILPFTGLYKLGSAVTSIPGVTSFGTQNVINIGPGVSPVAQMRLETDSGSSKPRISTLSSNLDLELAPDGTGNIALIGSPKITGLATPTAGTDAANKSYVDDKVEGRPILLSMDLSDGKSNSYIISNILNAMAPPESITGSGLSDYLEGTVARILCTLISPSATSFEINPLRSSSSNTFLTDLVGGSAPALTNIAFTTATVPAASISTTRIIKTFTILSGSWIHSGDTILPP